MRGKATPTTYDDRQTDRQKLSFSSLVQGGLHPNKLGIACHMGYSTGP